MLLLYTTRNLNNFLLRISYETAITTTDPLFLFVILVNYVIKVSKVASQLHCDHDIFYKGTCWSVAVWRHPCHNKDDQRRPPPISSLWTGIARSRAVAE